MSAKTMTSNAQPEVPVAATGRRPLVLASTSRYRRLLLERLGVPFVAVAPEADEAPLPGETPAATALRLAVAKARSVAGAHPDALIIGSDQVADCDGEPVGKPGNHERAVALSNRLSGRTVVFHTGLALLDAVTGACQIGARRRSEHVPPAAGRRARGVPAPRAALRLRRRRPLRGLGHRAVRTHRERRSDGVDRAAPDSPHDDAARSRLPRARARDRVTGRLYLVPNLLGAVPPEAVLPARTIALARGLSHFVVENAKPARAFLKSLEPARPVQQIAIAELGDRPHPGALCGALGPSARGSRRRIAVRCRVPGCRRSRGAPGRDRTPDRHHGRAARRALVGRAGADGVGHERPGLRLPRLPAGQDASRAREAIRRLESDSQRTGYAQLFIETPYRNPALLAALVATCRPASRLCVAVDLTLATEAVHSQSIRDWRGRDFASYAKRPAMFVLQA